MNENFLNAEEIVQQITQAFYAQRDAIKQNGEALDALNKSYKTPSDYIRAIERISKAMKDQANAENSMTNASIKAERLRQQEIATDNKRIQNKRLLIRLAADEEKQNARANRELQKAENLYNKVEAKVNSLTQTYNNLATRKAIGLNLNVKEEAQLLSLEKRLLKYREALSKVNANIGKYYNYASGAAQLNTAIGQFARELPNAGISLNTFIISLSNQFGQLVDGINATVAANKELVKQGQPVKSVLSQILSSVFSLQTALFLGIAVFTAYSKEIEEWVTSLFGANKELEKLVENQDKLNKSQRTGLKSTVEARTALKENLAISRDTALSDTEREIALKKLRSEYPLYFKNLTDQQILAGETAKAEAEITEALNKRAQANEAANVIAENDKRLIDLDEELKREQKLLKSNQQRVELRRRQAQGDAQFSGALANAENDYSKSQQRVNELLKERGVIQKQNSSQQELILKLRKESIGLDYQEETANEKKLRREALIDYEATEYELRRKRLELEAEANKKISQDATNGYADREFAAKKHGEILLQLAELRRVEQLRVLERETSDEIKELRRRAAEGEISQANADAVILTLQKDRSLKSQLIHEEYSEEIISANDAISESLKGVWGNLTQQERQNKAAQAQIDNLRQISLLYKNISGATTSEGFAKLENSLREIARMEEDNQIEELRAQKLSIDAEIDKIKQQEKSETNNEQINKLLGEQLAIEKQILGIENKRTEEIARLQQNLKETTNDYLSGFSEGLLQDMGLNSLGNLFDQVTYQVVNSLGEIETRTGSTFDKMIDQAGTTAEKFAITFNTISSVAQEAFNFMNQASQQQFDLETNRLQQKRDLAIKFAGDNQAAQEEINRQFEERQRDIRQRELKAQKEQALFNAAINIAQGVTAAYAKANIPLAILIGALGLVQISMIQAQQIPAYAEGTDYHKGGAMLVNDGRQKEVIETPDGKIYKPKGKNVVMSAPKGTKVYKSYSDFDARLNDVLSNAGIAPVGDTLMRDRKMYSQPQNNGLTKQEFVEGLNSVFGGNKQNNVKIVLNESGFSTFVEKGHSQQEFRNNALEIKGRLV